MPLPKIYQANREQFPGGGVIIVADASMTVEVKAKLATFEDTRAMTHYVLDFSTIL